MHEGARGYGGRGGQRVGFGAPSEDASTKFLTKSSGEFRSVQGSARQRQEADMGGEEYGMNSYGGSRDPYGGSPFGGRGGAGYMHQDRQGFGGRGGMSMGSGYGSMGDRQGFGGRGGDDRQGYGGRGGQRVGFGAPAEDKSTAFLTKSKDEFRAVHGSGRQRQEAENSQQGQYGDQYDSYSMGRGGGGRDMYGGGQDRYGGGRGPYQDRGESRGGPSPYY